MDMETDISWNKNLSDLEDVDDVLPMNDRLNHSAGMCGMFCTFET